MILKRLGQYFSLFLNERGEIGTEDGTASEESQDDLGDGKDTTGSEEGATAGDDSQAQTQEESFFDPKSLSPELMTQWKNMQASYTKKMQKFAPFKEQLESLDRFNSDPEYASQVINDRAKQLGLSVGQAQTPQQSSQAQTQQTADKAPESVVAKVRASLAPELQWMAQSMADSQWAVVQESMAPLKAQNESVETISFE